MASSSDMDSQVLVSYIPDSKEGMLAVEIHSRSLTQCDRDVEGVWTTNQVEKHHLTLRPIQELVSHQDMGQQKGEATADHESKVSKPAPNDGSRLRRMRALELDCVESEGIDSEPRACVSTQASEEMQSRKRKATPE